MAREPLASTGAVVLLGDSVLDNAAYTDGAPDVAAVLRTLLPPDWQVHLRAVDGSTCRELNAQLEALPDDATHLVVSIGGNDALSHADLLDAPARSTAEALLAFEARLARFQADLRAAHEAVRRRGLPTVVCTIYECAFAEPMTARLVRTGLRMFQDVLLRTAFGLGFDVLDLRAVCTEPGDFALEIEPSARGGAKIARAIAQAIGIGPEHPRATVHLPVAAAPGR